MEGEEVFINYGPKFFPTDKQEMEQEPTLLPGIDYIEHASDSTYSNISKDEDSEPD